MLLNGNRPVVILMWLVTTLQGEEGECFYIIVSGILNVKKVTGVLNSSQSSIGVVGCWIPLLLFFLRSDTVTCTNLLLYTLAPGGAGLGNGAVHSQHGAFLYISCNRTAILFNYRYSKGLKQLVSVIVF